VSELTLLCFPFFCSFHRQGMDVSSQRTDFLDRSGSTKERKNGPWVPFGGRAAPAGIAFCPFSGPNIVDWIS